MNIIRGETIENSVLLTPCGELLETKQEKSLDLIEQEAQRAFQLGRNRGERIGYEKAFEESKYVLNLLQIMTQKVLEHKKHLLEQLKPEIVEFVMRVSEKIIRMELSNPHKLNALIQSLLSFVKGEEVEIALAPEDYAMLKKSFGAIEGVMLHPDGLMQRGNCRIETESSLLHHDILRELQVLGNCY